MARVSNDKNKKRAQATDSSPGDVVLTIRISSELGKKIDSYADQLQGESPGGNWTRASAARNLIAMKIDDVLGVRP